jgi:predicted LPLAT superfamily acyltransferase
MSLCAIVPSHDHYKHIETVITGLKQQNLPIFIVDDGSAEPAKSALASFHNISDGITVYRLPVNGGKGKAVIEGFRLAYEAGFSHAVQVDADGQHDPAALPVLIKTAMACPEALVSGAPVYDETIPVSRKLARWLTHVWVWVETLSLEITDSMCGYRVYPIATALAVVEEETVGHYMDFDTEIMVRMSWRGTPVHMVPVNVTYPADNISNFRLVKDNWRITRMHTRLVFGMLGRMPSILKNRQSERQEGSQHWSELTERGAAWGIRSFFALYKLLGRRASWYLMQPILLYFFLTGSTQRRAARDYWQNLYQETGINENPGLWRLWQHYRSFGRMALDKLSAWLGEIKPEDLISNDFDLLDRVATADTGAVVMTSHLGNVEVSRALANSRKANTITVFAHTKNAMRFNRLLAAYNPASSVDVMEVEDIGPATIIELRARLKRGDWIVIAGDRVPVSGTKHVSSVPFLGKDAGFSEGPIIVASLLKCPVYILNCVREGAKYRILFEKMTDRVVLPRHNRKAAAKEYIREYVRVLEECCKSYPDQWYNFFDFWAPVIKRKNQNKIQ